MSDRKIVNLDISQLPVATNGESTPVASQQLRKRCGSCAYSFSPDPLNMKSDLECRFNPPSPFPFPAGNSIKIISFYPSVKRDNFCSHFEVLKKD
jgi:hypothetical protein